MKTALVAHGGMPDVASAIADGLRDADIVVDVMPAGAVHDLSRYDAVLIGAVVEDGHLHKDARQLLTRHLGALRRRPVWMFSTVEPIPQAVLHRVDARGHACFASLHAIAPWASARACDIATMPPALDRFVPRPPGPFATLAVVILGAALLAWIAVEMVEVHSVSALQVVVLAAALAILAGAVRRHRRAAV